VDVDERDTAAVRPVAPRAGLLHHRVQEP